MKKISFLNFKCLVVALIATLSVSNFGFAQQKELSQKVVLTSALKNNELKNEVVAPTTFEESDVIFNEIESEKEFEIVFNETITYLNDIVSQKEQNQIEEETKFLNSKKIPLYELFCSWKFHIS